MEKLDILLLQREVRLSRSSLQIYFVQMDQFSSLLM